MGFTLRFTGSLHSIRMLKLGIKYGGSQRSYLKGYCLMLRSLDLPFLNGSRELLNAFAKLSKLLLYLYTSLKWI